MADGTISQGKADRQRATYKGMMHFGYVYGLPISAAITMFFVLLLMQVGIPVSLILSFFTWLGVLGISKTFFVH